MLEWRNLWALFRLSYIPILPVIARVSAILYSANARCAGYDKIKRILK